MIKLRDAINLDREKIQEIKLQIAQLAKDSALNAYILDNNSLSTANEGVPILIKDNINVKDWEITCASKILKGYKSPYNASVINNLISNNLTPFGRSNMDEFAMGSTSESSCYGVTKNPKDTSRVSGGSSGGSAAAVAGGIAIAALGSDTGGSIRQPAGYCGCVGLKPTYGSVSRYGLIAYSSSLDQIGPITQDVRDCALLFDYIKGYDKLDSTSSKKVQNESIFKNLNPNRKFKIGVLNRLIKNSNKEIQDAYYNLIDLLKKLGHNIKEIDMLDLDYHISSYYITSMAEASSNLARFDGIRYGSRAKDIENIKDLFLKTRTEGFGEEVKRRILIGNFVLSSGYYDAYYLKAQKVRDYIKFQYDEIFKEVDIIISPIAPNVAPKIGEGTNPLEMYLSDIYTIGVNLAGLPSICIPIIEKPLPIGMQFITSHFKEQDILDLALNVEGNL
ncbi:Asp-tRNA(Asn)/Glu-tRNA(Gln) amidotransferase subunit GatA [Helicobacter sp. MIT 14-3879]|uniref:Asp-tRNA(Asn)/Glu-tRNA(Gln) amidotransferase subunit GatA n=1 Tax=Helicobacter sp. MIT 14-3879 TaxID=2040649 RepID=UPI000E1F980F|nr:Asp-tRNA(Asn)/Glu-tRNA(Gln) amidotransferase subunit GatA [Helicobacter sp. MIT 14-3879]RDU65630.1 Asp-tRNA(Asn)/Glu-tRNA(Gln) amidotransferase GatCAB subunit A [Helicobacter sp. MIT 14-3879]